MDEKLKKRMETDAKALSKMDFSDIGTEEEWFFVQMETLNSEKN